MPFGNITMQTLSYEPRKPGVYQKSGLALAAPTNELRLSGANPSTKNKPITVAATRVLQKDIVVGSSTVRTSATATINITFPNDSSFTATELDSLVADLNEFLTAATLQRLASGEI